MTIILGGTHIVFSQIVARCFEQADCRNTVLDATKDDHDTPAVPPPEALCSWALQAINVVGQGVGIGYHKLRSSFPRARISAISYPYPFTVGPLTSITPSGAGETHLVEVDGDFAVGVESEVRTS